MDLANKIAWALIAGNAGILLFMFITVAKTTAREGQQGWAMLITILLTIIAALGCGIFALGNHRKSRFVSGLAVVILGIPLIVGLLILFDELQ